MSHSDYTSIQNKFDNLPSELDHMEARWHLIAICHCEALRLIYINILKDEKAAYPCIKAIEQLERSLKRAYSLNESKYLLNIALDEGKKGYEKQMEIESNLRKEAK